MFRKIFLTTLIGLSVYTAGLGQEIKPKGYFLDDSLKIGQSTPYILTITYPSALDIVFPDSLYNISPFELDYKEYFPTHTDGDLSYDSAVYHVFSFEIDSAQQLAMPIFIIHGSDSTKVLPTPDTIYLKHLVTEVPDSLTADKAPLLENTAYHKVYRAFNYPYILIGLAFVIILIALVYILFGKKIRTALLLKKLQKQYDAYCHRFEEARHEAGSDRMKAEQVLTVWKQYLEQLQHQPITKLTTRELITAYDMYSLEPQLRQLDRTLYSQQSNGALEESFESLKHYAEEKYLEKVAEVKHD